MIYQFIDKIYLEVIIMIIMSIDLGDARTGLAICDKMEILAVPIGIIKETQLDEIIKKISQKAIYYNVDQIIVGYPKNTNGSIGERAKKTQRFSQKLSKELNGIQVILWDERNTTISAAGILNEVNVRGKKRKNIIDEVAAVIILESYLNYRKNTQL